MTIDLASLLVAIASVLGVGLLLGAGIPVLYALGVRARESGRTGSSAVSWMLFAVCVLLALAGIVLIVWGKQLFGI